MQRIALPRVPLHALALPLLAAALTACRIEIAVPSGGVVETQSGAITCGAGQTCTVEVNDTFFDETFVATPGVGYDFRGWKSGFRQFCGDRFEPCALSTLDFGDYPALLDLLAADETFYLTPVFQLVPRLTEDDFSTSGAVQNTQDGFRVEGELTMKAQGSLERDFTDSDLQLQFNANGKLTAMNGTAILPRQLTSSVSLSGDVRAEVGLYTGAQINRDDAFEIRLQDKRQYLVFLLSRTVELSSTRKTAAGGDQTFTIGTPATGKIIMILDPADDMLYTYGETAAAGGKGEAESDSGLLPFVPIIRNDRLDRFDGFSYETIKGSVGIKALDLLNLEGSWVKRDPSFSDIDFHDPFNSPVQYRAGYNGAAAFTISVAGFEFFSFDVGTASATFAVSKQRQAMTLATEVAPDVSWVPDWIPIVPDSRIALDLTATGAGDLQVNLAGSYRSTLPRADIAGSFQMTPKQLTMQGRVRDGGIELPVTFSFQDGTTRAVVGITEAFAADIAGGIGQGFDRAELEVEDALAALENAIDDYQFEVSLRGLRGAIPGVADTVISRLNAIPGQVYSAVRSRVISEINKRNKCVLGVCVISDSTRDSTATSAANSARSKAQNEIKPYVAAMQELKRRALEGDDAALRSALEQALREAYSYRRFTKTFSQKISFSLFSTTVSYTVDVQVLDATTAGKILTAADNMYRIPETSDIVVDAQTLVDNLPTQQILDNVRQAVESGQQAIPGVREVSYTVYQGNYSAAVVFTDGSTHSVSFNVLDPAAAAAGIVDLLVGDAID